MPRRTSRLRDWLFGSAAKRLLIAAFLSQPGRRWSKYALAKEVGVATHGGVDDHLAVLRQMGLVRMRGGRWELVPGSALEVPLRALLAAVDELPNRAVRKR